MIGGRFASAAVSGVLQHRLDQLPQVVEAALRSSSNISRNPRSPSSPGYSARGTLPWAALWRRCVNEAPFFGKSLAYTATHALPDTAARGVRRMRRG